MSNSVQASSYKYYKKLGTDLLDLPNTDTVKRSVLDIGEKNRKIASGIGQAYGKAYDDYLNALDDQSGSEQERMDRIAKAKIKYEKANQMWEAFMQFTSNVHQTLMAVIRQLGVR